MSKKIVVITGSPRKSGDTSALTAEFKRGAEKAGNTVAEFHLPDMKINGCLGYREVFTRSARRKAASTCPRGNRRRGSGSAPS